MKNKLLKLSVLAGSAILATSAFAGQADQYKVDVFTIAEQAVVRVTDHGQPVQNVAVQVASGPIKQTLMTSKSGSAFVTNASNTARSFKISVSEPNGETYTTQRFLSNSN